MRTLSLLILSLVGCGETTAAEPCVPTVTVYISVPDSVVAEADTVQALSIDSVQSSCPQSVGGL